MDRTSRNGFPRGQHGLIMIRTVHDIQNMALSFRSESVSANQLILFIALVQQKKKTGFKEKDVQVDVANSLTKLKIVCTHTYKKV